MLAQLLDRASKTYPELLETNSYALDAFKLLAVGGLDTLLCFSLVPKDVPVAPEENVIT